MASTVLYMLSNLQESKNSVTVLPIVKKKSIFVAELQTHQNETFLSDRYLESLLKMMVLKHRLTDFTLLQTYQTFQWFG